VSEIFLFLFFISSTYIIPAVVYTSYGHCHHLSVECLAICTHRKILPAIMRRNAGGISPRAHEARRRMCEGRFSVLLLLSKTWGTERWWQWPSTLHSGGFCIVALAGKPVLLYSCCGLYQLWATNMPKNTHNQIFHKSLQINKLN